MYKKIIVFFFTGIISLYAVAQKNNPVGVPPGRSVYNFIKINPKLQYVFVDNKPGNVHPREGDDVMMRMIAICNNRFMYSSAQVNKGQPGAFSISKAAFQGDIADALMLMTPGDSIICLVDAQSMYDYSKKPMPDYIKPGDKIQYNIRLVSIKPREELLKEREAAFNQAMQNQGANQNTAAAELMEMEDKALLDYFSSRKIAPIKTRSGMYYRIQKEGSGPLAQPGDTVVMQYRGNLLDGTVFDSNTDSAFMHVQPLVFVLGTGRVIQGWDEGIGYLNRGAKASFYIPSSLAYGNQSRPGNAANPKGIPANSVLIFDVELVAVSGRR
jgi:FKBP-type peptidyl-prolyl cis-trans isomerase FkpA